jgi:hypothetical protein
VNRQYKRNKFTFEAGFNDNLHASIEGTVHSKCVGSQQQPMTAFHTAQTGSFHGTKKETTCLDLQCNKIHTPLVDIDPT